MANSLAAKKRARQNEKRRLRNRTRRDRLHSAIRKFADAVSAGDFPTAETELVNAHRALEKAGSKGILHRNTVARRKSRLAQALNRAKAEARAPQAD